MIFAYGLFFPFACIQIMPAYNPCSLIDQVHSYSRLQITRDLFETLMDTFRIFPRFKEFVLLFGAKRFENEVGPPQMRFRKLEKRSNGSIPARGCFGFGKKNL